MATPKNMASGKGAAVAPLLTSFSTNKGNPGAGIWKKIISFVTAPPINANGTKSVAVVRGTGLGIVNGKQTLPGPTAGGKGSSGGGTTSDALTFAPASAMKFNLPPHQWSLPTNPARTNTAAGVNDSDPDHSMRRARMWYYGGASATTSAGLLAPAAPTNTDSKNAAITVPKDNYWGFQFLWNPEDFTTGLSRNSNVIPSSLDAHAALNGLFTAMEAISFKIVINRINDFACAKANYELAATAGLSNTTFSNYYVLGGNPGVVQDFPTQFKELMTQGTMADIEYIYRMINGSGQKGKSWVNGLGKKTADLAFLSPTAIALQLGPTENSLSYIGWIETMNVKHFQFTQDMIPIHSEVTISFNGFSRVSLSGA
jgi:hypothetical protein